ncbi:hypothetical protein L9F63_024896, partial [Diploptera punctata]
AWSFESATDQGEDTDEEYFYRYHCVDTGQQLASVSFELSTSDSYSSSDIEGSTKLEDILEGTNELKSVPSSPRSQELDSTPATTSNTAWDRCQRKNHRLASKKRREFGVTGHRALAHIMSEVEYMHPHCFKTYGTIYRRDYSVDKKSDALFREFSRCDPVKTRQRHLPHSYNYSMRLTESLVSDEDTQSAERTGIPVITLDDGDEDDEYVNDEDDKDSNV